MRTFESVFVVGAGTMGSGIAQVCAQAGLKVHLHDTNEGAVQKALEQIAWSVGKLADKGRLSEGKETILGRIREAQDFSACAEAEVAMEAVFERLDVKREIFRTFNEECRPETLFASNTSAIPITDLAAVTDRPENVLGLHFFNPAPMMNVVEVVAGVATAPETMQQGEDFVRAIGKEPIRVESDIPGFLLNRINLVSYIEAVRMVEQGIGTILDIDKGVKLAFGRRMGPFETGDMVGLDVSYGALMAIYEESKDPRFYPPQLLRRMVKAGRLGRKTGQGWYVYEKDGTPKKSG